MNGEVAERSIAAVLKTAGPVMGSEGSNPSFSSNLDGWQSGLMYSVGSREGESPVGSNPTPSAKKFKTEVNSGIVGHVGLVGWTGSSAGLENR